MKYLVILGVAAAVLGAAGFLYARDFGSNVIKEPTKAPAVAKNGEPAGPLDFKVTDIKGTETDLAQFKGKVVMIVNVASKCGFTKHYKGLEAIYKKYADQGFVILGFPANNFGHQEPGSNEEIATFCSSKYDVTFPMMAKISVNGDDQAPLYKFLTEKETAGDFAGPIPWNFTKFLVDRNGNLIARFATPTDPQDSHVTGAIEQALAAPVGEKK